MEETKEGDKTRAESGYDSYQTTDGTAKTTTISNVSKKTSLEVKKVWNDNNNSDKTRPESLYVQLYQQLEEDTESTAVGTYSYTYKDKDKDNNQRV